MLSLKRLFAIEALLRLNPLAVLPRDVKKEVKKEDAAGEEEAALRDDWKEDSRGRPFLTRGAFEDAVFQLADLWTSGVDPEE